MSLRECFQRVCGEYLTAREQDFAGHPLANFIRGECRATVERVVGASDRLSFKASAGLGTWARGPWVAIFDQVITTSAQNGFYPVYLFREDMAGFYLSLNQAMTEAKKLYKSDAKTALRARSTNYRAMLGDLISGFPYHDIELSPSSPRNDTAFYEAGNICAKFYPADHLPEELVMASDLGAMLKIYDSLVTRAAGAEATEVQEGDEPSGMDFEDATRFRLHKRIERNAGLSKRAKAALGVTCQVCGTNFSDRYGAIGSGFIEAHHLRPLASLKGTKVAMDPARDFAVLCSNCHRMVHRSGCVEDIDRFKREHFRR
ncbi:hypothetical protein TMEC54S_03220 [Thauera mechernichensis]